VAAILTPILMVLEVGFEILIPYYMSLIIDNGINGASGSDINYIVKMGLIMVGLSVLAMICGALAGYTSAIASAGFVKNLRAAIFEKVQEFSFKNIERFEVPSLVTRMTSDMRQMRMAYVSCTRGAFRAPFNLVFSAIMAFKLNPHLGIVFVVALPILGIAYYTITHFAHPLFRQLMKKFDGMNGAMEESFIAIRVVKTFVREKFEKLKFSNTSEDVMKTQRKAESIIILNDPFFNLVFYACMVIITYMGGKDIVVGNMTTGQFMSYLAYMKSILFSIMMFSSILLQIVMAQASVDRANEVLNEVIDITDENADPNLTVKDGSIEFKNVSFKYQKKSHQVALHDVSLKIESGETIGIIGSTGSSKSTMVQLIPRLYDVDEGEVLVGGVNVKDYTLNALRDDVAMVLQKNVLFSGTIEENMLWGNPNATHEEVVEACKCAQADSFIETLPGKYEYDLGQGGVNVSGGQKQRLCIARALLKKPKIIILDDSTSAVDTDTDKRIRAALKERLSGMTTIIIAQRIASVKDANKIVVMEDGKIADIGTHEQLLQTNPVYADLYNTQLQGVSE